MTHLERLREIRGIIDPITKKALAERRDFTADEQTQVRGLLDEAADIRLKIGTAEKSRAFVGEIEAFMRGGQESSRSKARGSRGDWTAALAEQVPSIHPDSKGITLPPVTSFVVPAPQPIVAQNVPFGHLLDVISSGELEGPAVNYLRSTTRTRSSRPVTPGALKPSKNLTLEKIDAPAETIAVLLDDIRKQDLDDYKDLVKWIDFELRGDVLSTLDQQMLLGTGEDDELTGIYFTDGVQVQSFASSASASLRRAMAKVEALGYENTAIVLNPVDYAELELELNTAGDYRGHVAPVDAGPRTVWGVPVASVPTAPAGLAIVGDLTEARLWIREQIQVTITETNEDDFKRNLFVARAEMRAAFGVLVPPALALVKLNNTVELPTE